MSPDYCNFFFSSRRRHTRSLCDWSSDVCSSDLKRFRPPQMVEAGGSALHTPALTLQVADSSSTQAPRSSKIGRASCRERVEISGVGGVIKKKEAKKSVNSSGEQR